MSTMTEESSSTEILDFRPRHLNAMPRPQTYGKRSRAVWNPIVPIHSSPEQPCLPPKMKIGEEKLDNNISAPRKALGEKSHNAAVLPAEAIQVVKGISQKSSTKRKEVNEANVKKKRQPTARAKRVVDPTPIPIDQVSTPTHSERITKNSQIVAYNDEPETPRGSTRKKPAAESIDPDPNPLEHADNHPKLDAQVTRRRSPRKAGKVKQKQEDNDIARDPENPYEEHCRSLLDLSSHSLTCYETWASELSEHFMVTKIAEASFGEVYRMSLREQLADLTTSDESVFKIIPLQPPESTLPLDKRKRAAALKKAEFMSKAQDVSSEVKLLQRMSAIPGFTNFRDVRILQGPPPEPFIKAFKAWNSEQKSKKKDLSHFPDPSKKSSYTSTQLWAVIEMQDAGNDLERLVENGACTDIFTIWDIFWQVVLSLAKGEGSAEFEHRDLHLGNICVRSNSSPQDVAIDLTHKLNFTPLETTIIDYTISRCSMGSKQPIAYTDLSLDNALFEGDSTDEYQYEIYRYMRSILFYDDAYADYWNPPFHSDRTWEQYHPQTNLVWLHMVLYKLLDQAEWPSARKAPSRKQVEKYRQWKRANELENVLVKVSELLHPEVVCENEVRSAGDLAVLAIREEWLGAEDVGGHGMDEESALISQLEGLAL